MKKLLLAVFTVCLIIPAAHAAITQTATQASDLLASDVDMLFEINTSVTNPIESSLLDTIKEGYSQLNSIDQSALVDSVFSSNKITLATNFQNEKMYILFNCKASEFNSLTPESYMQKTYNGYTIEYDAEADMYASYIKNMCVMTNSEANIKDIIDNTLNTSFKNLSSSTPYKNFLAKKDENAFLTVFMNPSSLMSADADLTASSEIFPMTGELLKAFNAEAFAVTQTTDGFKVNMYFEGDTAKLEELNLEFNRNNFVPKLYTKISGNKLIAYAGAKNLAQSIEDLLKMLTTQEEVDSGLAEVYAEIDASTGLNFETDILPLFTGEYLFAVHDAGTAIPAFTLVFDVSTNRSDAVSALNNLNDGIKSTFEEIEASEQTDFYTYATKTIQNTSFGEHKFSNSEDPEAEAFYLYFGVTSDGLLVASTHPELASVLNADSGLTVNTNFKNYFTNPTESIREILYFDVDNLRNYITEQMEKDGSLQEDIDAMNEVLGAWHNLYSKLYSTGNQEWGDLIIKADAEAIEGMSGYFTDMFESMTAQPVYFCDVTTSDWYYEYVQSLSMQGAVQGYSDGCFMPNNEITRAEFIKMVLVKKGIFGMTQSSKQSVFKDIRGDEWYADYVNEAVVNSYIKGYEDGTFRPNDPITRAEALQIISNVNILYEMQFMAWEEPFTDVNQSDWFYVAINSAYNLGVVEGTNATTFEPFRHLTRAEAAKLLSLGI